MDAISQTIIWDVFSWNILYFDENFTPKGLIDNKPALI